MDYVDGEEGTKIIEHSRWR